MGKFPAAPARKCLKHRSFMLEEIGEKPVTEIAGIGKAVAKKLTARGYDKAYCLLGQFLMFKKDENYFIQWLKIYCSASTSEAKQCYECLNTWCVGFL